MKALFLRRAWLVLTLCALPIPLTTAQTRRPQPKRPPTKALPQAKPPAAPLNIAVFSFKQTVGAEATATLGQGIADSLSNALKGVSRLAVADPTAFSKATAKDQPSDSPLKDEDTLRLGQELGLAMLVVGSYQSVGPQLIVDARILNVATGTVLAGSAINLSASFPDGYATLLTQLNTRVIAALRVQPTPAEAKELASKLASQSAQALTAYNQGLERMRQGSTESFEVAIRLFDDCLKADPAYALAYAAKAEAEAQLAELLQAKGEDSQTVARQAVSDAAAALQQRPNFARAHRAMARAQNAAGNYDQAAAAAKRAIEFSPNDAATLIALARALNGGELKRTPELDKVLRSQPWITFVFNQFPKVFVKNDCDYVTTVTLSGTDSDANPPLTLQPHAARVVAVLPGTFTVTFDCDAGDLSRQYELKKGELAELIFKCRTDIISTKVTLSNRGNSPAYVAFVRGARTKAVTVNPGALEVRYFQTGTYTVNCSGAEGGTALKSQEAVLRPDGEYRYSCDVTRRIVPRYK